MASMRIPSILVAIVVGVPFDFGVAPLRPSPALAADHADHDHEETETGEVANEGQDGADDHEGKVERGPQGGRLLRDGDFSVEITIFERGVPPEFRVFSYVKEAPVDPAGVQLEIELKRLSGMQERFVFSKQGDYLGAPGEVGEPHSFDVKVRAVHAGGTSQWEYGTYEGRAVLDEATARKSGITVETAGPASIRSRLRVTGQILPNEDRMAHLIPRFPGIVKEARKRLGDSVAAGEVVAVIQSNESLQLYELRSGVAGTVIRKHVSPGEFVSEGEEVYLVADLGTVWVDLNVYRQDFARVKAGQHVVVDAGEGVPAAEGTIVYLSPFGAPNTQSMLARVELANVGGLWRPGLFVSAEITTDEVQAAVAVNATALQTLRDWNVVFLRVGDVFEAAPVELGVRDGERVEVISGLTAGQHYADRGSFVLKAELGKAGASHDH